MAGSISSSSGLPRICRTTGWAPSRSAFAPLPPSPLTPCLLICNSTVCGFHVTRAFSHISSLLKEEWSTGRQIALELVSNEILDDSDIKGDSTTFANRVADAKAQLHLNRAANNVKWTAMIEKKEEDMKLKHDILVETRAGLPLKKDLLQVMLRYFTAKLGEMQTPNHSAVEDFLTPTSPDL